MNFDKYIEKLPAEFKVTKDSSYEYKLSRLYAYNFYFSCLEDKIDECNDGILGGRNDNNYLDGAFLNTASEEDQIDVLTVFYVPEGASFNFGECKQVVSHISSYIENALKGNFTWAATSSEFLSQRFSEFEDVNCYSIKVITNYVPQGNERNEYKRQLNQIFGSDKLNVEIVFGDDLLQVVEENTAPYDYVLEESLDIDDDDNVLKYSDNSFICNISALSLKKLWEKEGRRGLLAMNLRYYIKSDAIDLKIEESIIQHPENFWYFNNGIILVCDDYRIKDNKLILKKFSIVNGGQTTRMIGEVMFTKDFYIVCKVIKNTFNDVKDKNAFVADVAEASNTQKPIKAKDIIANRIEQRNLKSLFSDNGIFVEIKRGEKCDTKLFPETYQRTKNNEIAQDLFSFVFMQPGSARNNVTKILQQKDKYDKIFVKHNYSIEFYKDLLWLEKAYPEYLKKINKLGLADGKKLNLAKNGKLYALAVIGYLLKNIYNVKYFNCRQQYKNHDAYKDIYYNEQAFDHKFIKEYSYKEFKSKIFELFDYVMDYMIIPTFDLTKESSPSLGYSNFLKSDANFKSIITTIEMSTRSYNNEIYKTVASYFLPIDSDQATKNEELYENKVNEAINSKMKNDPSKEQLEKDKELEKELYILRINKSKEYNIPESKFFTDKQLQKIVEQKPMDTYQLSKITKSDYAKASINDIAMIVDKYKN